jgi:hypothetical protein
MSWLGDIISQAQPMLVRLGMATVAAVGMAVAARLLLGAERRAIARTPADASARLLLDRLVQFGCLVGAVLLVLSILGMPLTPLVTVVGMAGLAVSLALQDVLKNLVAGLYILVERPFTIGNKIQFRNFAGLVDTIQLRTTAIRTSTGERVVIPNAMIFAEVLVNRSTYGARLVSLRVVIPMRHRHGTGDGAPAAERLLTAGPVLSTAGPGADGATERKRADQLLRIVRDTGGHATFPAPRVLVESLTRRMITLRVEVWAEDARMAAARLAWAVRNRLPVARVVVLQPPAAVPTPVLASMPGGPVRS